MTHDFETDVVNGLHFANLMTELGHVVPVVAVDVNAGHLAVTVVAPDGNIVGTPAAIGLDFTGLPSAARDGRLRTAISTIIATARQHGARAIVIEDLDFAGARAEGRERTGSRPSASPITATCTASSSSSRSAARKA